MALCSKNIDRASSENWTVCKYLRIKPDDYPYLCKKKTKGIRDVVGKVSKVVRSWQSWNIFVFICNKVKPRNDTHSLLHSLPANHFLYDYQICSSWWEIALSIEAMIKYDQGLSIVISYNQFIPKTDPQITLHIAGGFKPSQECESSQPIITTATTTKTWKNETTNNTYIMLSKPGLINHYLGKQQTKDLQS